MQAKLRFFLEMNFRTTITIVITSNGKNSLSIEEYGFPCGIANTSVLSYIYGNDTEYCSVLSFDERLEIPLLDWKFHLKAVPKSINIA